MTLLLISAAVAIVVGIVVGFFAARCFGTSAGSHREREAAARLHQLAQALAQDVGSHNDRVQKIADDLMEREDQGVADVFLSVREIVEASETMKRKLGEAECRLHEQAEMIREHAHAARTDSLTQLNNRRALDEHLQQRVAALAESKEPSCLMLLDVDHFKKFNDSNGHPAGDEALRVVAKTLSDVSPQNAFVARYGGEEFAVVFPGMTATDTRLAAEMARSGISNAGIRYKDRIFQVTASAGMSQNRPGESVAEWIRRSDEALYKSKAAGRDQGHWRCREGMLRFLEEDPDDRSRAKRSGDRVVTFADLRPEDRALDTITGLSNRTAFLEDLSRRTALMKREGSEASLMLIKIDHYPELIQNQGFRAAEVALKTTTQFLRSTMREMDHIARYDQDSFSILLPKASLEDASRIAERLRTAIAECSIPVGKEKIRFTVSCGVAAARPDDEPEQAVARCREALDSVASPKGNACGVHDGVACVPMKELLAVDEPTA